MRPLSASQQVVWGAASPVSRNPTCNEAAGCGSSAIAGLGPNGRKLKCRKWRRSQNVLKAKRADKLPLGQYALTHRPAVDGLRRQEPGILEKSSLRLVEEVGGDGYEGEGEAVGEGALPLLGEIRREAQAENFSL